MPNCTWYGCKDVGIYPQVAKDGKTWANLCTEHNNYLDSAIKEGDAKRVLASWVKAQGGASAAASRMMER